GVIPGEHREAMRGKVTHDWAPHPVVGPLPLAVARPGMTSVRFPRHMLVLIVLVGSIVKFGNGSMLLRRLALGLSLLLLAAPALADLPRAIPLSMPQVPPLGHP